MKIITTMAIALLCFNSAQAEMRIWTNTDGKTIEAEFFTTIGDQVVVKDAKGKQLKIPMATLSPADLEYIELEQPPKLIINFTKQSNQRTRPTSPYLNEDPIRIMDYTFGAKVKQDSAKTYNHELKVEYFAIGGEITGDKNILLDRKESSFTPTRENDQSHQFKGKPVEILDYDMKDRRFGRKVVGNLITVTDVRGKIIAFNSSPTWLMTNIENLKQLPVGAYFDETCTRCYPSPPKSWY